MPTLVKRIERVELKQKEARTYPPEFKYRIRVDDGAAYLLTPYGEEIIVDLEDLERVKRHKWFFGEGRIYTRTDRTVRQTSLPKFLLNQTNQKRLPVSFKNGNVWDNRKDNFILNNEDVRALRESGQKDAARVMLELLEGVPADQDVSEEARAGFESAVTSVQNYIRRTFL